MNRQQSTTQADDNLQEGLKGQLLNTPEMDLEDADLIAIANGYIDDAKPLFTKMKKRMDKHESYYLGHQLNSKRLKQYEARIVLNKLFQSLETVLPRATSNLPAPQVSLPPNDDSSSEVDNRVYSDNLEEIMLAIADENKIAQLLKDFLRFQELYFIGVLKFGYDEETKEIWVENVRPQRILLPPNQSGEYVIEYHVDSLGFLLNKFPDKEKEIKEAIAEMKGGEGNGKGSQVGYYEITTPQMKFWKIADVVLEKIENPHWNKKGRNFWTTAQTDYIFSDLWTLGLNQYAQTTLVEQIMTIQDAINKRKRQISDTSDKANGVLVAYGGLGITKEEAAVIEDKRKEPNGVAWLENGNPGSVQEFGGKQLQPFVFNDMLQSIAEIDNIFGTHSTTRGEKTPGEETFGGRRLLKESDQERIGELVQMLERVMEDLYKAFAQLIIVHFKKAHFVPFIGKDGTSKQLKIDKNVIEEGANIKVRQGSTLIKDKVAEAAEAIQLWQMKAIDIISLHERLGDPHPFKTAERTMMMQLAPEQVFARVKSEYDAATKGDKEEKVMISILRAGAENKALAKGQPVPPFEGATPQHLALHQQLVMDMKEAGALTPEIAKVIKEHMLAEVATVKAQAGTAREEIAAQEFTGGTFDSAA
jgi:hypothetical protein